MHCTHYTHTVMYVISVSVRLEKGKERKDKKKSSEPSIRCFRGSQAKLKLLKNHQYVCFSPTNTHAILSRKR